MRGFGVKIKKERRYNHIIISKIKDKTQVISYSIDAHWCNGDRAMSMLYMRN